jgi:hypothetical protein
MMGAHVLEQARFARPPSSLPGTVCLPKIRPVPFREEASGTGTPETSTRTASPEGASSAPRHTEQYSPQHDLLLPTNLYGPRDSTISRAP